MHLPNHTQVPNDFVDESMRGLSGAAVKIFLAVCRKTIGWHKVSDAISYSQLEEVTGLARRSLPAALEELSSAGLVSIAREQGKPNTIDLVFTRAEIALVPSPTRAEIAPELGQKLPQSLGQKLPSQKKELFLNKIKEKERAASPNRGLSAALPKICFDWESGKFEGVDDRDLEVWVGAYPAIDLDQEFSKMAAWLLANPTRKKTNYRAFMTNWLSRAQQNFRGLAGGRAYG